MNATRSVYDLTMELQEYFDRQIAGNPGRAPYPSDVIGWAASGPSLELSLRDGTRYRIDVSEVK